MCRFVDALGGEVEDWPVLVKEIRSSYGSLLIGSKSLGGMVSWIDDRWSPLVPAPATGNVTSSVKLRASTSDKF